MSFDYLKDHLSPETVEKYGPKPKPPSPSSPAAAESSSTTETPRPTQEEAETGPGGAGGDGDSPEESAVKTEDASESAAVDPDGPKEEGEENATNDINATATS